MKIENIFCDVCGYKFSASENWDAVPAAVELNLQSPPRQSYESSHFEHVCRACVEEIKRSFESAIEARKASTAELLSNLQRIQT